MRKTCTQKHRRDREKERERTLLESLDPGLEHILSLKKKKAGFIYSFNKYFLSATLVPGTILGSGTRAVNRRQRPCSHGLNIVG